MIRLEPEARPSRARVLGVYLAMGGVAFLLTGGVFAAYGVTPWEVYRSLLTGTLGERQGLAELLRRTLPLLLIGSGRHSAEEATPRRFSEPETGSLCTSVSSPVWPHLPDRILGTLGAQISCST